MLDIRERMLQMYSSTKNLERLHPLGTGKPKTAKKSWSKDEIDILNNFFAEVMLTGIRPPTKKDVRNA